MILLSETFPVGTIVQLAPHTDQWMQGDRYAEVIGHTSRAIPREETVDGSGSRFRHYVRLRMHRSGRTMLALPEHLTAPQDRHETAQDASGGEH